MFLGAGSKSKKRPQSPQRRTEERQQCSPLNKLVPHILRCRCKKQETPPVAAEKDGGEAGRGTGPPAAGRVQSPRRAALAGGQPRAHVAQPLAQLHRAPRLRSHAALSAGKEVHQVSVNKVKSASKTELAASEPCCAVCR